MICNIQYILIIFFPSPSFSRSCPPTLSTLSSFSKKQAKTQYNNPPNQENKRETNSQANKTTPNCNQIKAHRITVKFITCVSTVPEHEAGGLHWRDWSTQGHFTGNNSFCSNPSSVNDSSLVDLYPSRQASVHSFKKHIR